MATYEDVLTEPTRINLKMEDIVLRENAAFPRGPRHRSAGRLPALKIRRRRLR